MGKTELTGTLMFGTIGVVLVILIVLLARFLRKPQNRQPMDDQPEQKVGARLDAMNKGDAAPPAPRIP